MESQIKPLFRSRPIASQQQAKSVIVWSSLLFCVFPIYIFAMNFIYIKYFSIGKMIVNDTVLIIIAMPSIILSFRKKYLLAILQFSASILILMILIGGTIMSMRRGHASLPIGAFGADVIWLAVVRQAWRAILATRLLSNFAVSETFA